MAASRSGFVAGAVPANADGVGPESGLPGRTTGRVGVGSSSRTGSTTFTGSVTGVALGPGSWLGLASTSTSVPIAATAVQPIVMGNHRRRRVTAMNGSSSPVATTSPVARENVVADGRAR